MTLISSSVPARTLIPLATVNWSLDAAIAITNAAAIAALGLRRTRLGLFAAGLQNLQATYGRRVDAGASARDLPVFEHTAAAVLAIAAVAIELEDWIRIRELVVHPPGDDEHYATWLRHGQVEATRASEPSEDDNLIELAAGKLGLHPSLGKSEESLEERFKAACVADQAALIAVARRLSRRLAHLRLVYL